MEKNWILKSQAEEHEINPLMKALNITRPMASLLIQRNIKSLDDARAFFNPTLANLHDPFLMKDMDVAVERIGAAIRNKERILIYGDYDVDGTTSVALIYTFLKTMYNNLDFYIPDRYYEGYGISFKGIDFAKNP